MTPGSVRCWGKPQGLRCGCRAVRIGRFVSLAALVTGLALIGWAALQGDLSVHLVVVVPVVSGSSPAAAVGMLLGMGGLVGWVATGIRPPGAAEATRRKRGQDTSQPPSETETQTRGGGLILIGPFPIAWGSDRSSLTAVIVAAIVLILVALAVMLFLEP